MAKNSVPDSALSSVEPTTLDEFCTLLSQSDRRTELIGAFHHVQKLAGNVKDTVSAFASKFEAFANFKHS